MAAPSKKYGLIRLPKKSKDAAVPLKKASIFDSDSEEDGMAAVNKEINLTSQKNQTKRQTQMEIDKALADDPNVYCYDELYDDMKNAEKEQYKQKLNHSKDSVEKKSRYIGGLMKAAEKRQKEHERRSEKKVQKEREAEGDEFEDKEKFVTSAYKKKMAELQALEEEEKRKEALEDALDVTKQSDMSGFYRNLYKQTLGSEPDAKLATEDKNQVEIKVKQEKEADSPKKDTKRQYRRRNSEEDSPPKDKISRPRSRSRSHSRDRVKNSLKSHRDGERREDKDRQSHRQKSHDKHRSDRHRAESDGKEKDRHQDTDRDEKKHKDGRRRRSRSPKPKSSEAPSTDTADSTAEDKMYINESTEKKDRFGKRNDTESVMSARERYLARKAAKQGT